MVVVSKRTVVYIGVRYYKKAWVLSIGWLWESTYIKMGDKYRGLST